MPVSLAKRPMHREFQRNRQRSQRESSRNWGKMDWMWPNRGRMAVSFAKAKVPSFNQLLWRDSNIMRMIFSYAGPSNCSSNVCCRRWCATSVQWWGQGWSRSSFAERMIAKCLCTGANPVFRRSVHERFSRDRESELHQYVNLRWTRCSRGAVCFLQGARSRSMWIVCVFTFRNIHAEKSVLTELWRCSGDPTASRDNVLIGTGTYDQSLLQLRTHAATHRPAELAFGRSCINRAFPRHARWKICSPHQFVHYHPILLM